eukprot:6293780-Karenia_brevis.AAC.1
MQVFIPKKKWSRWKGGVAAKPMDTRPIALKNTDCKSIHASINRSVSMVVSVGAVKVQRGFVAGRQL